MTGYGTHRSKMKKSVSLFIININQIALLFKITVAAAYSCLYVQREGNEWLLWGGEGKWPPYAQPKLHNCQHTHRGSRSVPYRLLNCWPRLHELPQAEVSCLCGFLLHGLDSPGWHNLSSLTSGELLEFGPMLGCGVLHLLPPATE